MPDHFKPLDRDTLFLLPPSVQDWLPQDHHVRALVLLSLIAPGGAQLRRVPGQIRQNPRQYRRSVPAKLARYAADAHAAIDAVLDRFGAGALRVAASVGMRA